MKALILVKMRFKVDCGRNKKLRETHFPRNTTWMQVLRYYKLSEYSNTREYFIQTVRKKLKAELEEQLDQLCSQLKGSTLCVNLTRKTQPPVVVTLSKEQNSRIGGFSYILTGPEESEVSYPTRATNKYRPVGLGLGGPITEENEVNPFINAVETDNVDAVSQLDDAEHEREASCLKDKALDRLRRLPAKDFLEAKQEWDNFDPLIIRRFGPACPKLSLMIGIIT